MRLFNSISRDGNINNTGSNSELDHYLGNMSEALIRVRAQQEINNAREAAQEAIRIRSTFLENMNHELRTPLNAIIGFASMMLKGEEYALDKQKKDSYAEYILQSADLLLGHINTILEIAAFDTGSHTPSHGGEDCQEILGHAIERIQTRARSADVNIVNLAVSKDKDSSTVPTQTGWPKVWADQQQLSQALDHLLQTAIKSCGSGGKVLTRIMVDEQNWTQIQIRDDGKGFSEEEIEESLNSFTEINTGLQKPFTGPGLGIALAKTFVEMQGGTFTIKSKEGTGTLSTISLPPASNFMSDENITDDDQDDELSKIEDSTIIIAPNLAETA